MMKQKLAKLITRGSIYMVATGVCIYSLLTFSGCGEDIDSSSVYIHDNSRDWIGDCIKGEFYGMLSGKQIDMTSGDWSWSTSEELQITDNTEKSNPVHVIPHKFNSEGTLTLNYEGEPVATKTIYTSAPEMEFVSSLVQCNKPKGSTNSFFYLSDISNKLNPTYTWQIVPVGSAIVEREFNTGQNNAILMFYVYDATSDFQINFTREVGELCTSIASFNIEVQCPSK